MAETTARPKYSCPACGAEANWNAAKQALVCPYCGTESPASAEAVESGGEIVEHDLVRALRGIPDSERGWQAQKTTVRCQSCQAISVFDPERVAQRCDFCGSASLVPYEEIKDAFRPESLLPFKVSETKVRETIRRWYGGRWFAPNKLKSAALTDQVHGIYLPYWTFDAQVYARWRAEAGYYYYETQSYRDAQGNLKERRVQHTRWEPASGDLQHFFDDELVAASRGVQAAKLRGVEPFPTAELIPYDPKYVSGWVVERYQIDLVAAAEAARRRMEDQVRAMCASKVPGDTHRNLQVKSDFSRQTFKHVLVPIWMLTYRFGATNFQVVINGYTGKIAGDYPKSWIKILLAVLLVLVVVVVLAALFGEQ
ncbi:MAG: zinc ribbon domain-containing protein [Acidobacteria bacterium]|nr:zinc ribbon domain-containing protein [Acidobacteriota bacterium]MCW5970389.1 zinc ribbon domain-containing protein [Blastocatellales bacterium]